MIEKVTSRVRSWTCSSLSFSGRLYLLSSVIQSFLRFWCNHFILPSKVILEIQQIFSNFVWKGKEVPTKEAKVKWADVCLPRNEDGLGIKETNSWNSACILRNLLQTPTNAGSLWVAWAQWYLLKFKCTRIIKIPNT